MLIATQGLVLHTTPYAESSVVAKVFTRHLGVRSYIIKGVRGKTGRVKQNLLQPLSSLDMVVYDNHRNSLNYIKEMSPRRPQQVSEPVGNALRFFMTEVLYKALHEEEPMQELWDYVEQECEASGEERGNVPIVFMLRVAQYLGIRPLDNYSRHEQYFDLQEGHFVDKATETTLSPALSELLHEYLSEEGFRERSLQRRTELLNALIAYYQLHLSGFNHFTSHEILHMVLRS